MDTFNQANAAGRVGDHLGTSCDRNEGCGTIAVKIEDHEKARLRIEKAAKHAEEMRLYLPIGDDQMPA